ncbi:MAG: response regulator [Acidobacteriota bacterium]
MPNVITSPTPKSARKILAVLDDLFFQVKINEAAKRAGLPIEFVKSEVDAVEKAKASPQLIILDLNCGSLDSLALIQKLKASDETRKVDIIGYVSHVQGELKLKAQEAGCNSVLARSAFSVNLPQILKRHSA